MQRLILNARNAAMETILKITAQAHCGYDFCKLSPWVNKSPT
jgi:hypothetical protein